MPSEEGNDKEKNESNMPNLQFIIIIILLLNEIPLLWLHEIAMVEAGHVLCLYFR